MTFNSIALLRQQILTSDRIHGIITDGGQKPNMIPHRASACIWIRSTSTTRQVFLAGKLFPEFSKKFRGKVSMITSSGHKEKFS